MSLSCQPTLTVYRHTISPICDHGGPRGTPSQPQNRLKRLPNHHGDGLTEVWTDIRNFSPFYRTSSSIGAGQMDGERLGISAHPTGLPPISGLLPCFCKDELGISLSGLFFSSFGSQRPGVKITTVLDRLLLLWDEIKSVRV